MSVHGGDRAIGRKLDFLLRRSGFVDVSTTVEVVDAARIGLDNFLGLTYSYKWQYFPKDDQERACQQLRAIIGHAERHVVSAFCGVYAVSGRRPEACTVEAVPFAWQTNRAA
ncbi:hypothetical protein WCLP8_2700007 [uncultured Gammaproteobacteria bacterium]